MGYPALAVVGVVPQRLPYTSGIDTPLASECAKRPGPFGEYLSPHFPVFSTGSAGPAQRAQPPAAPLNETIYAQRVVGWSLSTTPDTALVTQAVRQAVETRRPKPGLLFHSDQGGGQYRSKGYRDSLARVQITPSMSRKGNC